MNRSRSHWFSLALAAALMAPPIAGLAAESPTQMRVVIGDINLHTSQGVASAYARLQSAAHTVCGRAPDQRELGSHIAWTRCVAAALEGAVAQIHSAALADLHARRSGRTAPVLVAARNSGAR
jgi:UrcA family protein